MSVQKVIQGQVTAIEPRANGWAAVSILAPGKQHPVKLSTKRQDLLGEAQQLAWQMVDALYNEEESTNINPHNGQPYVNRYLEQLAPAGQMPQPQPAMQQPVMQQPMAVPSTGLAPQQPNAGQYPPAQQFGNLQPQLPPPPAQPMAQFPPPPAGQAPVADDERESRIMRQTATKVAANFLPMLAEEDRNLGSLIRISEQLLKYYREGVSWTTNPPEMGDEPAQAQYENSPPPPSDEDIPF